MDQSEASREDKKLIRELLAAIEAKEQLLSCHRLQRNPSEKLWRALDKASVAIEQARERLRGSG